MCSPIFIVSSGWVSVEKGLVALGTLQALFLRADPPPNGLETLMPHRIMTVVLLLAVVCALALPGRALAGTLDQIKKSGEIRLGYRTDSLPLAFNDPSGQPSGY